ncbi:YbjN domain-containing protein [Streptomyces sp. NBC_01803]|uniref:YbjN domain-containing protein n=1 Tax=Streptomyces sp. NBC_01803 TaxID=2975946 RepID=UPI002DDB19D2|nr:YbjN domain-containing protein [Streptomyces sp. NBC_01803]WSA45084.1 YbjN domain-containing protein [Streptomyces sp. NBC_01803]
MSVDPSAIPSFGGPPDKQKSAPQAKKPTGPIMPNPDLIKQLLDRMKVKYVLDKEGDVVAPWKNFRVYFMFRGEERQRMLIVRTFYSHPHSIDDKPRLLESVDEWNHSSLWPKVYTHTQDDGVVRMVGDFHLLLGAGVAFDHFVASLVSWVRAAGEFDKWIVERLGLAKDVEESADADADGDSGGSGNAGAPGAPGEDGA